MKNLNKKLRKGKVVLHYNNDNLEGLKRILDYNFPDGFPFCVRGNFYKRSSLHKNCWVGYDAIIEGETRPLQDFIDELDSLEWTPKRGDRVLISNDGKEWTERIFLTEIKGAFYPFQVVDVIHEKRFLSGKEFFTVGFGKIKQLTK